MRIEILPLNISLKLSVIFTYSIYSPRVPGIELVYNRYLLSTCDKEERKEERQAEKE